MTIVWILVANASQAVIYTSPKAKLFNGESSLDLVSEFDHPDSKKKSSDIASDKSGHYQGKNVGHGDFVEATSPKEYEAMQFAKELSHALEAGRVSNKFGEIILVAPPHFQGLLMKEVNNQLSSMICLNIQKDYTKDTEVQLRQHLSDHL